jgi:ribosomal protein L11 methylase PrmA
MSMGVHNTKYTVALLRASLGLVTGVDIDPLPIPKTFELSQNYPNPFNPSTRISFSLPKPSPVSLQVFDMMGRVVATLVDEVLPAGNHATVWNGRTSDGRLMASGIYFYRLKADGYIATRKMMLLK